MSNSKKITAEFEIVTPMFLGGADHEATRIRETSIKGALAFWWRALNYARFVAEAAKPDSEKSPLALMQTKEQELFGGPKGQGVFLLRVVQTDIKTIIKGNVLKENDNAHADTVGVGARYLGYGLMGAFGANTGKLERSCIKAGGTFSLQILFKQVNQATVINEIIPALKLFGLLGGLGSRVRRGWGSVALTSLTAENIDEFEVWEALNSADDYSERIKGLFNEHPSLTTSGTDWLLTAFAQESRICLTSSSDKHPLIHLNNIGEAMQRYRSWGFSNQGRLDPPQVNGQDSEKNFKNDHDWSKGTLRQVNYVPQRAAFGLPQNYKDNAGVTGKQVENKEKCINRRASPLGIHVHKTKNGQSFVALVLLPTKFLPSNEVNANGNEADYDFHNGGLVVLEHFLNQKTPEANATNPYKHGPYLNLSELNLGDGAL